MPYLSHHEPGALPQAGGEHRAFGANHTWSLARAALECAQIVSSVWIFRCECFDIADFNICRFNTRPFRARTEEPAPKAFGDHARGVKRIARNQKLDALTTAKIRTDYDAFARAIAMQHQHLDGITELIGVKLVIADAMQPHRCIRRYHEIERRPGWSAVCERWRQTAGCNLSLGDKSNSYETAHRRLQL